MFWTQTETDEASRQLPQEGKTFQQTKPERKRSIFLIGASASDDSTMNKDLHCLNEARWPFAARLHFSQVLNENWTTLELFREQVCRRDGVLNSKVDSHPARRGHDVRRVADAKQSLAAPILQTIDLYRK